MIGRDFPEGKVNFIYETKICIYHVVAARSLCLHPHRTGSNAGPACFCNKPAGEYRSFPGD
jgi:hypothetical protein